MERTGYELTFGEATVTEPIPGHEGCFVTARRLTRGAYNRYQVLRGRALAFRTFEELPPADERARWAALAQAAAARVTPTEGANRDAAAGRDLAEGLSQLAESLAAGGRMVVVDPEALQESLDWLIRNSLIEARFPAADGAQRLWSPDAQYNDDLLEHVPPALETLMVRTALRANGLIGREAEREEEALGESGASPEPTGEADPAESPTSSE